MENKKRFSILKAVIRVIAILLIAVSLVLNITFSGGKTPHIFGRYIYIVSEDSVDEGVTAGAAIFASEFTGSNVNTGSIVLCNLDGYTGLQLRGIGDVIQSEDGQTLYATSIGSTAELDSNGDRVTVSGDDIAAVCTGCTQSLEFGKYVRFSTNIKGILLQLILPCVVLMIFLIAKIASSKDDIDEEEDYDFYEYDEEESAEDASRVPSHEKQNSPLFEPSQEIKPSNEFERKKMSIAENFSQKEVDHNSSYQKEKERTMQLKAQRSTCPESPSANYRARHQSSAESSFAARNMGGQSSTAPTADALREEMLRKTAEAERSNTKTLGTGSGESASDITGIYSKAQLVEMANADLPKTAPLRTRTTPPVTPSAPASAPTRKSSSPNIDDIISKSENDSKKKSVSDMSIDDLLKLIEDEKKKL